MATTDFAPAPGAHDKQPESKPRRRAGRHPDQRAALGLAAPAMVLLSLFLIIPVILAFTIAFTNMRLISPNPPRFVGLDNFIRALIEDEVFRASLLNTFYFAAVVVPVQAGLGLILALLVNQKLKGRNIFRTIYFIPVVTSMVVVSILWRFMYQEDGLINSMLSTLTGGAVEGTAWLSNPATAMPAIMVLSVWQGVGFHMVIWLAGLQTIPQYLYEAAELDGTNRWQRFRYVTMPGLKPTMVFVLVTITIAAFALFVQIDVMTQGGPLDSTSTLVFYAVRKGYREQEMGYGAAISLIFFVLVLAVSLVQRYMTRDED